MKNKEQILFVVLGGFFIVNALLAEFIGVKLFSLEKVFGQAPVNWNLFGQKVSFTLTAGVILWPVVFVMTDIINEYFGKKGVRFLSYLTAGLISYAFIMTLFAVEAPADAWWVQSKQSDGVDNLNTAFQVTFSQGLWIIIGSLVAFLFGQFVDVFVFQALKRKTGEGKIWLRATGSTLVSQFIDSFIVLFIAFKLGANWPISLILAVGLMNYTYKFIVAILLTPVIYLVHALIDRYLGHTLANQLKLAATGTKTDKQIKG